MGTNLRGKVALILAIIFISAYYTYANVKWYGLNENKSKLAKLMVKFEQTKGGKTKLTPKQYKIIQKLTPEEKSYYLKLGWLRDRTLNLGLDLRGGMDLVLDVDTEKAFLNQVNRQAKDLERYLQGRVDGITIIPDKNKVRIKLAKPGDYTAVKTILRKYKQWKMKRESDTEIILTYSSREERRLKRRAREQALEVIRNRVDEFGVTEPSIQPQGASKIIVQLPGMKDPERAKRLIGRTALLEFNLVDTNPEDLKRALKGDVPAGYELKHLKKQDAQGKIIGSEPLLVKITPELTGADLTDAFATFGQRMGNMIVQLKFNRRGGRIMSRVSGDAARKYEREGIVTRLAIILDGTIQSAPQMKVKVSSSPVIEGDFTPQQAKDLALVLRAGALPAPISIVEERMVGASLGADSIKAGIRAAILGLIVVAVFIGVYYLLAGLIANFALALNLIIILAVLSILKATLSLPGIAGIILTIGMAVDANVLIFERIREELRIGKTVRSAIATGYQKAFRTILDANVTTLIAAIVLFRFGSGPVRGFAVTLSVGILTSMFTAVVVTRVVFDFLCHHSWFTKLKMMHLVGVPHIGFVKIRKLAFIFSALMIIVGMTSFFLKGEKKYGIDFIGGTLVQRSFREPVSAQEIRKALSEIGLGKSEIQQFNDGKGVIIRAPLGKNYVQTGKLIDDKLKETFKGSLLVGIQSSRTEMVGPTVGKELRRKAILALLLTFVFVVIYVAWRFEFKFGIAAILALLHDVLITAGFFALSGRQFSLPIIAALLTIIGYSLNDTIVVFDRIRENLKLMRKEKYKTIINVSLNQTLARTLLTSLTTFLVVLSLYLLGGEIIRDFAFTMMIGIIVGTYSSIFVASPILIEWQARLHKRGQGLGNRGQQK